MLLLENKAQSGQVPERLDVARQLLEPTPARGDGLSAGRNRLLREQLGRKRLRLNDDQRSAWCPLIGWTMWRRHCPGICWTLSR
jgi:hypothetical protein